MIFISVFPFSFFRKDECQYCLKKCFLMLALTLFWSHKILFGHILQEQTKRDTYVARFCFSFQCIREIEMCGSISKACGWWSPHYLELTEQRCFFEISLWIEPTLPPLYINMQRMADEERIGFINGHVHKPKFKVPFDVML